MNTRHSGYRRAVSRLLLLSGVIVAGAALRQGASQTVADFEGGKAESVHGLALVVITDEQLGGTSEARLTVSRPGVRDSRGALRISFRTTGDFAAPFAGVWALVGAEGLATDLSAYEGVRFHARTKEGTFLAGVSQFAGRAALYMAPFEATREWTVVELPFHTFRRATPTGAPAGGGSVLVPRQVVSIGFAVSSQLRGLFDLEIDQVELYR